MSGHWPIIMFLPLSPHRYGVLALIYAGVILTVVAGLEYRNVQHQISHHREQLVHDAGTATGLAYQGMDAMLQQIVADTLDMASRPEVRKFVAMPEDRENRVELTRRFSNFAINKRIYGKLRVIDLAGQERIRVNYRDDTVTVTAASDLQDKRHRYYFQAALLLQPGQVYVSPMDLNMEHKEIERPLRPVMRFVTPVTEGTGRVSGILVITYHAQQLLDMIRDPFRPWTIPMLLNREGYWLLAEREEDAWGFMLPHARRFQDRDPSAWDRIATQPSGRLETPAGIYAFDTVHPFKSTEVEHCESNPRRCQNTRTPPTPDYNWKLVSFIPASVLKAHAREYLREQAIWIGMLLLVFLLLSLLMAYIHWRMLVARRLMWRESALYQHLLESLPDIVYGHSVRHGMVFCSPAIKRVLGFSSESMKENPRLWHDAIHEKDVERVDATLASLKTHPVLFDMEYRIRDTGGGLHWFHDRAIQVEVNDDDVVVHGVAADITRLKESTKSLRLFRSVIEQSTEAIAIIDPESGLILDANQTLLEFTGLSFAELMNSTVVDIDECVEDQATYQRKMMKILQEGHLSTEGRFCDGEGRRRPVEIHASLVVHDKRQYIIAIMRDITQRLAMEQGLRESEARYRALAETVPGILYQADVKDFTPIYVSGSVQRLLGCSASEMISDKTLWERMMHAEDRARVFEVIGGALARGGNYQMTYRMHARDGRVVWFDDRGIFLRDAKGVPSKCYGIMVDVTAQKSAEAALADSEQRLRSINEAANDAIILTEDDGTILSWNPAAQQLFGYAVDEAMGKKIHELLLPPRTRRAFAAGWKAFRKSGRAPVIGTRRIFRARHRDGHILFAELSGSALCINGRWHAVGIVRDVTQRRNADRRIREMLEERGVLLSEIHHRVKNNMQVVSSLIELQAGQLEGKVDDATLMAFRDSENRVRSMALVHQLLYSSKNFSHINFNEYLQILASNLLSSYTINSDQVHLDIQMEQVTISLNQAVPCGLLVNELLINAIKHAFPDGREGTITVAIHPLADGRLELVVADDGVGLPAGLDFSTVSTLGLRLIGSLVRQLGGDMEVDSSRGTRFSIQFKG